MSLTHSVDRNAIARFCERWQVCELALFGSAVRDDLRSDSDVDVMVTFAPDAPWSLWDLSAMRDELKDIFRRPVDLVEKRAIKNPFRRRQILNYCEVIHAA
ncbi:MAG TPA: nucleotidyltransferase family protein [Lacipirellulaceae bacterium]|nr:nucleotidyltransferase family protein [Lacipirellulaceae bacterium]